MTQDSAEELQLIQDKLTEAKYSIYDVIELATKLRLPCSHLISLSELIKWIELVGGELSHPQEEVESKPNFPLAAGLVGKRLGDYFPEGRIGSYPRNIYHP